MKEKAFKFLTLSICFVFFCVISFVLTVFIASAISAHFAPALFKSLKLTYDSKMVDIIVFGLFPLGFMYLMGAVGLSVLLRSLWLKLKITYIDKP